MAGVEDIASKARQNTELWPAPLTVQSKVLKLIHQGSRAGEKIPSAKRIAAAAAM